MLLHTLCMRNKTRREEFADATRASLLKAARVVFVRKGYAATGTEEVVRRAGMTRGALYHHFRDKLELFTTIFEDVERELAAACQSAGAEGPDPWTRFCAGCHAYLDACLDPAVQQIVLLDAPVVLGWKEWRRIDSAYGLGLVEDGLRSLAERGVIAPQPAKPMAHLLLGAMNEAGMMIAGSEDVAAARKVVGKSLDQLLQGLRIPAPSKRRRMRND